MTVSERRKVLHSRVALLCGGFLLSAGCAPAESYPVVTKDAGTSTGGRSGSGGAAFGSGGGTGSGGAQSSGGSTGSGGALGSGGTTQGTGGSNDSGTGGASGDVGGAVGTGGAAGMSGMGGGTGFLSSCGVSQAKAANVVVARNALISNFTYTDGTNGVRADGFSFGNYQDSPSGYSYHYPVQTGTGSGGAGEIGGAGGAAGAAGAGGAAGSAGGHGGVAGAAAGHAGTAGTAGTAGAAGSSGAGGGAGAGGESGSGGAAGAAGVGGTTGPAVWGLAENLTGSNWHITGVVNNYSAFAISMACMTDASAFAGIQFTIRGNVGSSNMLRLQAGVSGDEPGSTVTPSLGMCEGSCTDPIAIVNVTDTATVVRIPWSMFTGGRPLDSVNPAQLTALRWLFTWNGSATPYPVDVTVDDLQFYVAPPADDAGVDGGVDLATGQ